MFWFVIFFFRKVRGILFVLSSFWIFVERKLILIKVWFVFEIMFGIIDRFFFLRLDKFNVLYGGVIF